MPAPAPHARVTPPAPMPKPNAVAPATKPAPAPATVPNAAVPNAAVPKATPPAAVASAAPAAAPSDRILNPAEVPDLPKLAISGGVYSDNAAQRMLIVGGQVVNEGAELAPGVTLEQIRPKSAVLRFRGLRVAVPY